MPGAAPAGNSVWLQGWTHRVAEGLAQDEAPRIRNRTVSKHDFNSSHFSAKGHSMLRQISSAAAAVVLACFPSFVSAAIIFNGNLTSTTQIRSATNNPFFNG